MPRNVLVVEDDASLCRGLVSAVQSWGHDVVGVETLAEARAQFQSSIDLLLIDVRLPDGNAADWLEKVGKAELPETIAMSGKASAKEAFHLATLGVSLYLDKPIDLSQLHKMVGAPSPISNALDQNVLDLIGRRPLHEMQLEFRRTILQKTLDMTSGNRAAAARLLGITRQAVQYMCRELDI